MHMSRLLSALSDHFFGLVHTGRLIYNACWEDPRLDRRLLSLGPGMRVGVISSAGDNAIEYLLDGVDEVVCVDMNYRQNALVELKKALYATANPARMWEFFGLGASPKYRETLHFARRVMPAYAADFWYEKAHYFAPGGARGSFYYHGAAGDVAFLFSRLMFGLKPGFQAKALALLEAQTLEEQERRYAELEPLLWDPASRWLVSRHAIMALLGVPRPQIALIEAEHPEGLYGFVRDKLRHVFTSVPLADNYFWRAYLTGAYTPGCAPEYVKPANFQPLALRAPRLSIHTGALTERLELAVARGERPFDRLVLLDHQDWLASHLPEALEAEWRAIFAATRPGARILMRSAGLNVDFIPAFAKERLRFFDDLTRPLHAEDRVGTYGSQHLMEVMG